MAAEIDVVLFDLGGVLVRLGGVARIRELAGIASEDEVWRRWLACPWVRSFERGDCDAKAFADGVVQDWGLPITADAFLDDFRRWPEELFEGAVDLVREAKRHATVGCLSNTNPLHWNDVFARWGFDELFDVMFISYELGLLKPDREIFDHVTAALGVAPERILFLDDAAPNVEQARAAGFGAEQVRGVAEARRALNAHLEGLDNSSLNT